MNWAFRDATMQMGVQIFPRFDLQPATLGPVSHTVREGILKYTIFTPVLKPGRET